MPTQPTQPAFMEMLENRTLFATTIPTPPPAPPKPPATPKPGIVLTNGVLAIGGNPTANNTISVTLSADGKSVNVKANGKAHAPFSTTAISDVIVAGGNKNDTITVSLGSIKLKHPVAILGLAGNDKITAGAEADAIWDGAGNDTVTAGAGNDLIVTGPGKDVVHAGDGNDMIFGNKDDLLDGGAGKNVIHLAPPPPPAAT